MARLGTRLKSQNALNSSSRNENHDLLPLASSQSSEAITKIFETFISVGEKYGCESLITVRFFTGHA